MNLLRNGIGSIQVGTIATTLFTRGDEIEGWAYSLISRPLLRATLDQPGDELGWASTPREIHFDVSINQAGDIVKGRAQHMLSIYSYVQSSSGVEWVLGGSVDV